MAGSREEANFVCDASPLSINDLQKIFEALYEARDKWRNLGGVFGVSEATLRCIAKEEDDEDSKLRRVISTWLETHGGTSHCSWRAAAQALRNITVGRHDVAHEVCANHSTSGQASSGRSVVTTPREDAELSECKVHPSICSYAHMHKFSSSHSSHSSATRDILAVTSYLIALDKPETMTLGQLLGLRRYTVTNTYEGSTKSMYLDSVITAWLNKQDDVIREGLL